MTPSPILPQRIFSRLLFIDSQRSNGGPLQITFDINDVFVY